MTSTTIHSDNRAKEYDKKFFREYVRNQTFSDFTGTGLTMPIVIKESDMAQISVSLITRLSGNGVSGSTTLSGNEENIGNYAFTLSPTHYRHAVVIDAEEAEKPNFDIYSAADPLLREWAMDLTREQIVQALCAVQYSGTYANWADASAANRNTWLVANSDRVLFGTAKSNYSGVVATDLAKVDSSNDTLDKGVIGIAKRMAMTASPAIRPWKAGEKNYEQFVLFAGSRAFRDLYSSLGTELQNARERGTTNPIWQPGDLFVDGVLVREVPEITSLLTASSDFSAAGNGSIAVEPCFLVGQQALGWGLQKRPKTKEKEDKDYDFVNGLGIQMKHDIKKFFYNAKQHGVVTIFVAGVADA
jgi:hypothetical protein